MIEPKIRDGRKDGVVSDKPLTEITIVIAINPPERRKENPHYRGL